MTAGPARPAASAGGSPEGAGPSVGAASDGASSDGARRKRRLTMFLAGVVGALVVIAVAVLLTGGGGDKKEQGTVRTPTTSASVRPDLLPG
ncbi:hypothetical protein ACFQ51_25470 [Streptomyces kaempferi]